MVVLVADAAWVSLSDSASHIPPSWMRAVPYLALTEALALVEVDVPFGGSFLASIPPSESTRQGGCMYHEPKMDDALWLVGARKLTMIEPDEVLDELGSWWRDLAAGSALAAFVVTAAVMFLR